MNSLESILGMIATEVAEEQLDADLQKREAVRNAVICECGHRIGFHYITSPHESKRCAVCLECKGHIETVSAVEGSKCES